MDRRVAEASALRELFHHQWLYLRRLIRRHELDRRRWKREQQQLCEAVETIVGGTDCRMRGIHHYQKRLRNSARGLINYIGHIISELPPALDLGHSRFNTGPVTSTVFRNHRQIATLFSQSRPIQTFFQEPENQHRKEVYALLFLSHREKSILGSELRGELILREVRQTQVVFGGYQLQAPSISETQVRNALKRSLFESSVEYLQGYMARMRHGLLDESEREELPEQGVGVDNPETYLRVLEWLLSLPLDLIKVQSNLVRIDDMGIVLPATSSVTVREVELKEVEVGNSPARVIAIVRYPRDEIIPATELSYVTTTNDAARMSSPSPVT